MSKLVHHQSNGTVIASYEFERDNLGRLIRSRQVAGNNATVQRTEHIYDAIGRISQQRWAVGSKNYSESYTYNDGETGNGKPNTVTTATGDQLHYEYNDLQQLQYAGQGTVLCLGEKSCNLQDRGRFSVFRGRRTGDGLREPS